MTTKLIRELGASVGVTLPEVRVTGGDPVLPSVFPLGTMAAASAGALTAAVAAYAARAGESEEGEPGGPERGRGAHREPDVTIDVRHATVAFQSERHFRADGKGMDVWAALSGDYRTSDGWVRLHCNFDHHRDAALRALGLPLGSGKEDVVRACAGRTALEIEEAVIHEGGCAAAMRSRAEWLAHPQAQALAELPLVGASRLPGAGRESLGVASRSENARSGNGRTTAGHVPGGPAKGRTADQQRPLDGVRVLDLTRVIAGPVAARALAAYGAEVLRVGAAHLPEVPGLVVETAFGKRSCHIDLRSESDTLRELVRQADVIIQAYRPGALRAKGFGPDDLTELRPGIVCVDISAYGTRGPWADRRGFDSLVQMACGIAHENGDGLRPNPLPAQALDHGTGYLAAFGAVAALLRRADEGGSWHVEVSLARTATWLDGLGRIDAAGVEHPRVDDLLATMTSSFGTLTYVTPPGAIDGVRPHWTTPPPRQGEHPAAWATSP
ncbi:CoA transferase [Microbispora rosea subsp. aerata]|nr:CoA transferase [Microbispora rosea]GGO15601.1 CoA transferase [Microbispora rosea subsp. aerata]GIH58654.1 CoA transferase [Microbispora rosea subsp. aerata]GLJ86977.1 CoA transferase [Microbispora rosea subsp. aerata]